MIERGELERVPASRDPCRSAGGPSTPASRLSQCHRQVRPRRRIPTVVRRGPARRLPPCWRTRGIRATSPRRTHYRPVRRYQPSSTPPLGGVLRPFRPSPTAPETRFEYPSSTTPSISADEIERDAPKSRADHRCRRDGARSDESSLSEPQGRTLARPDLAVPQGQSPTASHALLGTLETHEKPPPATRSSSPNPCPATIQASQTAPAKNARAVVVLLARLLPVRW